ncbi:uncharacterized protein A4U43_C08F23320 [Asparagus officinalis]|uniref:uncharacterized protein LOC109822536 n=1 Tax=Asparagus officinalis TaxID=4686 RepID=UPI00098E2FBA|nr:uncharacterized protein LOC109822536 [Asparagus officinalis]ONK60845.1 uncharacterized protein A4U43_C08F23320 [Asparagus officinalis]
MEGEKGKKKRVMVTFDVDGTLIRSIGSSSNRLHRLAFSHAFLSVFNIPDSTIDVLQHHGQTDPLILVNTCVHYGIPSDVATERLPDLKSKMIEYAKEHAKDIGEGLEVLPGVTSLLEALSSNNVAIGLVTGNLEEIGWMKMEGLGIQQYFTVPNFGGFGSDHTDRGELVKIAAARAEKQFPGGFDLRVHIGDTPNDIRAAEYGGALAVGVCTGVFSGEELKQASNGSAIILADLKDTASFLRLLGVDG